MYSFLAEKFIKTFRIIFETYWMGVTLGKRISLIDEVNQSAEREIAMQYLKTTKEFFEVKNTNDGLSMNNQSINQRSIMRRMTLSNLHSTTY